MAKTIASLRRGLHLAAAELRNENQQVNVTALARKVQMPRRTLGDILAFTMPKLNDELAIVTSRGSDWNRAQVFALLEATAKTIINEGQKPSCENMAAKLSWRYKRLQRYLREHPELQEKLDLHTDLEAQVWKVGRQLRFDHKKVTIDAIARKLDLAYETVLRVLGERNEWRNPLLLERAKRNSGVMLFVKTPKSSKRFRKLSSNPPLPAWCKDRKVLPKPHTLQALMPLDRVIAILEYRYRLPQGSLVHPLAQDWRFTRIRYLAMYLMHRDLLLSSANIASVMNLKGKTQVHKGIKFIESQLPLLGPELTRLGKFY